MKTISYIFITAFLTSAFARPALAEFCYDVPETGQCLGNTLNYCANLNQPNEQVVTVECSSEVFPVDITGQCIQVSTSYGYDCAVPQGERCIFQDDMNHSVTAFCAGNQPACVIDDVHGSSSCQGNIGVCNLPDPGQTLEPECMGDVLVTRCHEGQPVGIDCTSSLGHCNAGRCIDSPAGESCDAVHLCATGLECDAVTSRCIDPADHCDPATDQNSCIGEDALLLRYCSPSTALWTQVDCSLAIENAVDMACGPSYNCIDDDSGQSCANLPKACVGTTVGASCNIAQGLYCSAGLGCVSALSGEHFIDTCQTTATCDFAASSAGCVNDIATYCIGDGQRSVAEAAGFNCTSMMAQCQLDDEGTPICAGDVDGRCDDLTLHPDSPFRCAQGLICLREMGDALGHCAEPETDGGLLDANEPDASNTPDAGLTDLDASLVDASPIETETDAGQIAGSHDAGGNTGAANDSACGCQTSKDSHSLGLMMLFGFILVLQRRRHA